MSTFSQHKMMIPDTDEQVYPKKEKSSHK